MHPADNRRWFLARNKQKLGPFSTGQIRQMASGGMIQPSDMVLEEGKQQWCEVRTVEQIWSRVTLPDSQQAIGSGTGVSGSQVDALLALQPGEDFFPRTGPLTIDPDDAPAEVAIEPTHLVEQPPSLTAFLWTSTLIGASLPFFTCCIIAGGRIDVPAILGVLVIAALIGGLLGAAAGWMLHDGAAVDHRNRRTRQTQEHEKMLEETRQEMKRMCCPSCSRPHARIELVRGTLLSGPVEQRQVIKKCSTTRHLSSGFGPGRTYKESATGLEFAPTRRSYLVSVWKCKFCDHTWQDRDDEGHREISPDGHPRPNFAYETLQNAVSGRLKGG